MRNLEKNLDQDLKQLSFLALQAKSRAYAPYSNFRVGACVESGDGHFFSGCNVENVAYPVCQCAEATAVGKLISDASGKTGSQEIKAIYICSDTEEPIWPCGSCRQQLAEFATPDTIIYSEAQNGVRAQCEFASLIPKLFSKSLLKK